MKKFLLTALALTSALSAYAEFNKEGIAQTQIMLSKKSCVAMSLDYFVDPRTKAPFVEIGETCVWRDEKDTIVRNIKGLKVNGDYLEFQGVVCGKINREGNPWTVTRASNVREHCFWSNGGGLEETFKRKPIMLGAYKYPENGTLIYDGPTDYTFSNRIELDENDNPVIVFESRILGELGRFSSPDFIHHKGIVGFKGKICGVLKDGNITRPRREFYSHCKTLTDYFDVAGEGHTKTKKIYLIPKGDFPTEYLR
jgi:hypothetical protein